MTGRELIIYILQNNLEDIQIFSGKGFMGFVTESEAAVKFNVGLETIRAWFNCGVIDGVKLGDNIYILPNTKNPHPSLHSICHKKEGHLK